MSHFTVMVVGNDVARQLQPFHEFECTGTNDEFVQDIDKTEEALAEYAKATVTRFRAPDGALHDPFDAQGYWKPEFCRVGEFGKREMVLPPGFEEVEVPAKDHEPAAKWISGYFGWNVLTIGREPGNEHKYGRIEVDADGNVVRCIDRTNPNKKWDWWVVGGRWTGFFKLKPGASGQLGEGGTFHKLGMEKGPEAGRADQVHKGDIDIDGMRDDAGQEAGEKFDQVHAIIAGRDWTSWEHLREVEHKGDIKAAREAYHAQPVVADLNKADVLGWSESLERYRVTREQFVATARAGAMSTFAVLKDGRWHERGSMGWWGMAHDEKDEATWAREFGALIDSLPDDTLLTVVDCHI